MPKISKFSVLSIFCCLILGTFTACDKDKDQEKSNLSLKFEAKFQSNPLELNQYYAGNNSDSFYFNKLNFFVSDIKLVDAQNQSISLTQESAYFIDFSDNSTLNITLHKVPTGTYTALQLGIGIPAATNAKEPGDFDASHILSNPMHYWTAWSSYVFSRVEGIYKDADGELGFLYHGGIDEMYQYITLPVNLEVTANNSQKTLTVQADKIFYPSTGRQVNVKEHNMSHGGQIGTTAFEVGLNIIEALGKSIEMQ